MNISIEEKKAEAVSRMKLLGIFPETIRQFEEDGYISRNDPPIGEFFWVEGKELDAIREFEQSHDAMVYLVIRSYTSIGMMDSYLFVSDYREEWEMDSENFKDSIAFAYVTNYDDPQGSEMGDIGIKRTIAGGLQRIW